MIGLHARDLHIEQVLVDGVEAHFEILNQNNYDEVYINDGPNPAPYTKSNQEAADDAYKKYSGDLHVESQPELLIFPPPSKPAGPAQVTETTLEVNFLNNTEPLYVIFVMLTSSLEVYKASKVH